MGLSKALRLPSQLRTHCASIALIIVQEFTLLVYIDITEYQQDPAQQQEAQSIRSSIWHTRYMTLEDGMFPALRLTCKY